MLSQRSSPLKRSVVSCLAATSLLTLSAPFARADPQLPRMPAMTTKKKALVLGGAALLYYLYKKHQANKPAMASGGRTARSRQPQLYRSRNGGVYYRDAGGKPVWLTVPSQSMEIPAQEVRRYAPDYARYRGPAPAAPRNYRTQDFSEFDDTLLGNRMRN